MSTVIRPNLSKKNKYYIDKHRHYELKHFCLQYAEWKKRYLDMDGYGECRYDKVASLSSAPADPTARTVDERMKYFDKMRLVEQAAIGADAELSGYIFKAVTEDLSYNYLKTKLNIPCGRDTYYDRYRRFFWLLDKSRN